MAPVMAALSSGNLANQSSAWLQSPLPDDAVLCAPDTCAGGGGASGSAGQGLARGGAACRAPHAVAYLLVVAGRVEVPAGPRVVRCLPSPDGLVLVAQVDSVGEEEANEARGEVDAPGGGGVLPQRRVPRGALRGEKLFYRWI